MKNWSFWIFVFVVWHSSMMTIIIILTKFGQKKTRKKNFLFWLFLSVLLMMIFKDLPLRWTWSKSPKNSDFFPVLKMFIYSNHHYFSPKKKSSFSSSIVNFFFWNAKTNENDYETIKFNNDDDNNNNGNGNDDDT